VIAVKLAQTRPEGGVAATFRPIAELAKMNVTKLAGQIGAIVSGPAVYAWLSQCPSPWLFYLKLL